MLAINPLSVATTALLACLATAIPLQTRQTASTKFSLSVQGEGIETGYQTVSYANDTAFIGHISEKIYAEPLIVTFAASGLTFTSYHDPAGFGTQQLYITPNVTEPLGFSPQGESPPAGAAAFEFGFSNEGDFLTVNGENNFIACQSLAESEIESYELWWQGGGAPNGVSCLTDIQVLQGASCSV